jgi:Ca2+:H+ antiporter
MLRWLGILGVALGLVGLALLGDALKWRPAVIFALALVSLIPLAGVISEYTEKMGAYLGDVAGGLLDATFGNAPEIIIGLLLITNIFNIVDSGVIVKALIIGSIISNALFVLGSSTLVGSIRNGRMRFSADRAGSYASMLALAVVGLALPALAVYLGNNGARLTSEPVQLELSAVVSVVLLVCYGAYLAATIFGVGERAHPKNGRGRQANPANPAEEAREEAKAERDATLGTPVLEGDHSSIPETEVERLVAAEEHDEDAERRALREKRRGHGREIAVALLIVTVATTVTVVASVLLLSQMDTVIRRTSLTPFFVGFILLPIVTNAVEQIGTIVAAFQNHMEQAMAVAAGSGVQMALLVAPLLMLASLALGHPLAEGTGSGTLFGLIFSKLELIIVTLVTLVYALVSLDGETTWLEGLQLIAFYAMVAATAFFLPGA